MRKFRIKDPFCGISHAVGAGLAVIGLIALILLSRGKPWHLTSFAIYGGTLVLLYIASALYHSLPVGPRGEKALYGFDRAAIYALIAGTYTPICLLVLPPALGWSILGVVWGLAVVGVLVDLISRFRTPDWLQALLYLAMGWVFVVAIGPLVRAMTLPAFALLIAGSLIYTFGAVICVANKPHIRPGVFHAHDLWHVLVLAGSVCHFLVMLLLTGHGV
jgi:hemolysin III